MKDYWLQYAVKKGLEKREFPNPPHLSRQVTAMCLMRVLVPVPRMLDPMIILEYILVHQLILWVDSPGDKVVQGSVVADDIETPSDAMGVVAGPSSGFGIAPALRSKSPSHFNPDDGSYHGGQNLADLNEKEDPLP